MHEDFYSMTTHHIALIDSGIGGLSVLAEIEAKMPGVAVSYFMDNLYLPYGELSEEQLLTRLERIVAFLLDLSELDIIVIACNTASTQSLDFLRQRFKHTFVGVVPAIKPAAIASVTGYIGLLATPATVRGCYIDQLIDDFASHCVVQRMGSSELVHLAEAFFWQGGLQDDKLSFPSQTQPSQTQPSQTLLSQITGRFKQVDTIVLGCTHFPLIKAVLQQALGGQVLLIDSGAAIANRVCVLLGLNAAEQSTSSNPAIEKRLFSTSVLPEHKRQKLVGMGFNTIEHIQF